MKTIPNGYKQTEVGVIPSDWEVDYLEKYWTVTDCKHITATFVPEGYSLASIKEVQSMYVNLNKAMQTTKEFYSKLIEGNRKPLVGDLIFSRNATVGEVAQVAERHPPFAMGQDVCLLRKNRTNYSTNYLQTLIKSPIIRNQIENLMVGSTFKRVNVEQIRNFYVPFPSPKEQSAIASILSDADALITQLEKLIDKKRNIKQGAMQELLRPKEGWEVKKLGEIAEIVGGGTPSSFIQSYWNGTINWFTPTEIGEFKYTFESVRKITKVGFLNCSGKILPIGTILLTTRAGIGDLSILMCEGCTNQGFQSLICKEGNFNEYVYYLMQTLKNVLIQNASGSTFLEISPKKLKSIEILIPKIEEQTRIAKILTDMDAEIEQLEKKLEKYKMMKQGMMQNLLTGKIRIL